MMKEVEQSEERKSRIRAVLDCGLIAEDSFEKQTARLVAD